MFNSTISCNPITYISGEAEFLIGYSQSIILSSSLGSFPAKFQVPTNKFIV